MERHALLTQETLPPMPLGEWEDSRLCWQLMTQILGKIRLTQHPWMNHWWHVTLYVTPRGTTTGEIPYGDSNFDLELDLTEHKLILRGGDGQMLRMPLDGRPIAEFYAHVIDMMDSIGISVPILAKPYLCKSDIPFAEDRTHTTYDPLLVHRAWSILRTVEAVFKEFRGRFIGKCSPVHQFWHSFDLACTRFNGRKAPDAGLTDPVASEAYSRECISAGFWFGDDSLPEPAFYSYTWPAPDGLTDRSLRPGKAFWREVHGSPQATLLYEDLRKMDNPRAALLDFLQSSYEAGADLAEWDRESLER